MILLSINFGAGMYAYYGLKLNHTPSVTVLRYYLSPVWDVIDILFLGVVLYIADFLPLVMKDYGEPLLFPAVFVVILLIGRAMIHLFWKKQLFSSRGLSLAYGLTGIICAVIMTAVLTISEGGYLFFSGGHMVLDVSVLLTSFYFWAVTLLAAISVFYISAIYLLFLSKKSGNERAAEKFRSYALVWSVPTLLSSALIFIALERHNPEHFNRILDLSGYFLLSLVFYMLAVTYIFWKRYYGWAFFFVLCQYFFAFCGYGISHLPYLLYPYIEVHPFTTWQVGALSLLSALLLSILIPLFILRIRRVAVSRKSRHGEN